MTTDAWQLFRSAFAGIMRRLRSTQAEAIDQDLEATRLEVRAARQSGDEQAELELLGEWRNRLRRLISDDEQFQRELRSLIEEFAPLAGAGGHQASIIIQARASGSGRVNQAGRDQTVIGG
jgi:hypothetical protein